MAGDIGDQDANVLVVEDEEIVEVSGDGAHGKMACRDFEARKARNFAGKKRGLNLARDFEFLVDGQESFFVDESAMCGDVPQAAYANQEAQELNIRPWNQAERRQIGVKDKEQPDEKTREQDADVGRDRLARECAAAGEQSEKTEADNGSEHENVVGLLQLVYVGSQERRENAEHGEQGFDHNQPAEQLAKMFASYLV